MSEPKDEQVKCPDCDGDGWNMTHAQDCKGWERKTCNCTGEQIRCEKCNGSGKI